MELSACTALRQERYRQDREWPEQALAGNDRLPEAEAKPVGLIDGYEAGSRREMLLPLVPPDLQAGEVIRYRPLGCSITHFARMRAKRDGLLVVHIVGPRHRMGDAEFRFTDTGLCMVIGFEGDVKGKLPSVGQTVRFTPADASYLVAGQVILAGAAPAPPASRARRRRTARKGRSG